MILVAKLPSGLAFASSVIRGLSHQLLPEHVLANNLVWPRWSPPRLRRSGTSFFRDARDDYPGLVANAGWSAQ
jgi:hypothetical protein